MKANVKDKVMTLTKAKGVLPYLWLVFRFCLGLAMWRSRCLTLEVPDKTRSEDPHRCERKYLKFSDLPIIPIFFFLFPTNQCVCGGIFYCDRLVKELPEYENMQVGWTELKISWENIKSVFS